MLVSYDFLTEEECSVVREKVFDLRSYWLNRGGYFEYPFFSLGTASYMDAVNDPQYYYQACKKTNIIIKENFSDLLNKLALFLEEKLGKPTLFHPRMALPGFHIFLSDEIFEIPIASRHVDLQYQLLDWGELKFDHKDCISFTVYIRMPSAGSGLYLWDYLFEDLEDMYDQDRQDKLSKEEFEYRQFKKGQLVIHDGLHYHQIAAMENVQESDERISLQGHAILSNGIYYLYW
jgi:hypothetical protein